MAQEYGLGRGLASLIPQKQGSGQGQGRSIYADAGIPDPAQKASDDSSQSMAGSFGAQKASDFSVRGAVDSPGFQLATGTEEKKDVPTVASEVHVEKIQPNPFQPRTNFDQGKLDELANSIKQHGIIQPLVVTKKGDDFELVAGERRLQAAKLAGIEKVPVVVKEGDDKNKMEWAIIENIQRHDLNPIEEAKAYKRLVEENDLSQTDVAEKMGKSRSLVANKMRLLELPIEIQKALIEGKISEGHAKAILSIEDDNKKKVLLDMILKDNLTVRQTEKKTDEIEVKKHKRAVVAKDPWTKEMEGKLTERFGTKVNIKKSGEHGGAIVIEYYSDEELSGILEKALPEGIF